PNSLSRVVAPPDWAFLTLCLGLLVLGLMVSRFRYVGAIPICAACFGWASAERPDVLISDTGKLVGVQLENGRALNKPTGAGFVAGVWLENDGDLSKQDLAAQRWGDDLRAISAHERTIYAASGKRGLKDFTQCSEKDIAVFSEAYEGQIYCEIFDIKRLRSTGSVALNFTKDGTLEIITARAVAGQRYWNDRDLRKARLNH
ncbi:MAG: competence protein, partial [Planktotalea sp.]